MSNAFPFMGSSSQVLGATINPNTVQNTDGSISPLVVDRQGALMVRELGGRKYIDAARGNLFWAAFGGASGVIVKAAGGTAAVAALYNPLGSGVLLDVHQLRVGFLTTTTEVIANLIWEGSVQTPSAVTKATVTASPLGLSRGAPVGLAYQAATIVAATYIGNAGIGFGATAALGDFAGVVDYDGTLVVAPGFTLNLAATALQTENLLIDMLWSERLP